ncbi:MAG: DUF3320 domain-containing protein, partial [Verrucomicrobiales bacterium]|nr:DUF3320 domain-containing protein [Verrucomicrobiales bacterium]
MPPTLPAASPAATPASAAAETPPPAAADSPRDPEEDAALPPVDDTVDAATGIPRRHTDTRLQTRLAPEFLQRRLLDLSRDAQTTLEETGVNVLYLALGQLKWFEADAPHQPRYAPLVLVPAALSRRNASDRFQLRARDEDVEENLSLRTKLDTDFGVVLPPFPDPDAFDLAAYYGQLASAIANHPNWEILPDAIVLGCFSFAKLLLYRDLAPEAWPETHPLLDRPFLPALLATGFPPAPPPIPESTHLDDLITVERLDHVVDADASQTVAIEMVRQGRNLVLHGPPGTGKSQSIANIIATAVLDGKKVLFVAEKLAALEVVQRRLQREGLGDLCLELHSNKASKRAVLEEIGRTWRLGKPRDTDVRNPIAQLEARRAALNDHCRVLHSVHAPTGLSAYRVLGELIRLGNSAPAAAAWDLVGAESWNETDRDAREALAAELGERIRQIGPPARHPWRGVRRPAMLPTELDALTVRLAELTSRESALRAASQSGADAVHVPRPEHLTAARRLALRIRHLLAAPRFDAAAMASAVWETARADLRDLVAAGLRFRDAQAAVEHQVTDAAWDKDFEPARGALAAHGRSFLRFLDGSYRRALADLRSVAKSDIPSNFEARLAFADHLVAGQTALRALRKAHDLAASAFGGAWRAERSDWTLLRDIVAWVDAAEADGLGTEFRSALNRAPGPAELRPLATRLDADLEAFVPVFRDLAGYLDLDLVEAFGVDAPETVPFDALRDRVAAWRQDPRAVFAWSHYEAQRRRARDLGLAVLVDALGNGGIPDSDARPAFRRACFTRVLRELSRLHPSLARFDGTSHDRLVDEFRRLDRERLAVARYRVLATHHEGMPPMNTGVGAVGIVTAELERKRGHRPVRQLLRDAGSVVQAIKPVFMMSPLSVAQFLAPGAVEFDLLVVDEASQIQPVDALGAVARTRQIVVVGDNRQLPPTRFFARVTGDDTEAPPDSGAAGVQDIESILGLCVARGLPSTMLQWHYRSRHHSLIAVSNREFYEDRLFIAPSPRPADDSLGLRLHPVADGVFDSGGTGTNRVEAKTVCRAVIDHARRHPGQSLGVAAFSVRQQQAILDELELLRRENPETEAFFNAHPDEPFFVKNLENVQGDERDTVFISIGYGRDADGVIRMNFGPLGAEGGERRLNVLISRARRRCVVFSSLRSDDIDLDRASGRGVRSLKAFLRFAESGRLDAAASSADVPTSPFEETLREALTSHGHDVQRRVGIAGFFVDLAVADPRQPGRFVLGVECDGPSYGLPRSARDRDRLRHAVLHDQGWKLHRLWIVDWFQNPEAQLRAVLGSLRQALESSSPEAPAQAPTPVSAPANPAETEIPRERPEPADANEGTVTAEPYVLANFAPPKGTDPATLDAPRMADLLHRIVEAEGPIHEDELVVRVRDLWELSRAGARLQDAVARGVRALLVARRCIREEGCLDLPDRPVRVRSREGVASPNLRKPDMLPPSEIRTAILRLVEGAHGVFPTELAASIARVLGFRTTPPALRLTVENQAQRLATEGRLVLRADRWIVPEATLPPVPPRLDA